jgi:predicted transcriptional regulator
MREDMPENPTADAAVESDEQDKQFVTSSSKRTAVLGRLVDGPAEPSEVATKQSVSVASVESTTNSLSVANAKTATEELRDRGLVELLVTDETRAYGLTAKGERVLFALERSGDI